MNRITKAVAILGAMLGGLALAPAAAEEPPGDVVFRVAIDSKRGGTVLCALYDDEDDWLTRRTYRGTRAQAHGNVVECRFRRVPSGTYAIASLHDEDGDGKMDKNLIGLPTEGYACSRNAHLETIFAPDWDDAIFQHRRGVTRLPARMKY